MTFRLTRTYSIASLLGIVLIATALGVFHRNLAVSALVDYETRSNLVLTQLLSNTLWEKYRTFVTQAARIPRAQLAARKEVTRLNEDIRERVQGLRVVKIKIYNLDGLTVYSSDPGQIGENKLNNSGFRSARDGTAASEVVFRDQFSAFEGKIENRNLLSSYLPMQRSPGGPVEAVFEVYSDVTPLIENIRRTEYKIVAVVLVLMLVLYVFLLAIVRRADRVIRIHEDEERHAQREEIRFFAYHDPLTGLANRALFNDRLYHALLRADHAAAPCALLFLDLDRFKVINDSLGQEGGDQVLIEAAARIRASIRPGDTACRLDADKFAVIIESAASHMDVETVARQLIDRFAAPMRVDGHELIASPSIGITFYPGTTRTPERVLTDAEAAMRHAKVTGRNSYVVYTEEDLHPRVQEGLEFETGLRKALSSRELAVYYQPIVESVSGAVVAQEALLRWRRPGHIVVQPDDFVTLLEETGMIVPVGAWVLREACKDCRQWHADGYEALRVCVNISLRQFRTGTLVADVRSALADTGLPGSSLELELTESAFVEDIEHAIGQMRELKKLGVQLSIDDFGVGYSSLNYLRRFPIDCLKIDRGFIREITINRSNAAITKAIAAIARGLDLRLVAEGVETEEQAVFLESIGCSVMQGYLYSDAAAPEQATAYLAAGFSRHPGRQRA